MVKVASPVPWFDFTTIVASRTVNCTAVFIPVVPFSWLVSISRLSGLPSSLGTSIAFFSFCCSSPGTGTSLSFVHVECYSLSVSSQMAGTGRISPLPYWPAMRRSPLRLGNVRLGLVMADWSYRSTSSSKGRGNERQLFRRKIFGNQLCIWLPRNGARASESSGGWNVSELWTTRPLFI